MHDGVRPKSKLRPNEIPKRVESETGCESTTMKRTKGQSTSRAKEVWFCISPRHALPIQLYREICKHPMSSLACDDRPWASRGEREGRGDLQPSFSLPPFLSSSFLRTSRLRRTLQYPSSTSSKDSRLNTLSKTFLPPSTVPSKLRIEVEKRRCSSFCCCSSSSSSDDALFRLVPEYDDLDGGGREGTIREKRRRNGGWALEAPGRREEGRKEGELGETFPSDDGRSATRESDPVKIWNVEKIRARDLPLVLLP